LKALDEFYLIVQRKFYDNYFCPVHAERPFKNVHTIICPEGRLFKSAINRIKRVEYIARRIYLNRFVMPDILKDIDPDLMFYPFNDSPNNVSLKYPFVGVIHDLFYKISPTERKPF